MGSCRSVWDGSGSRLIPGMSPVSSIVSKLISVTGETRVRQTGSSPLHLAAERNHVDVLEVLIRAVRGAPAAVPGPAQHAALLLRGQQRRPCGAAAAGGRSRPGPGRIRAAVGGGETGLRPDITVLVEHGADINASIPMHQSEPSGQRGTCTGRTESPGCRAAFR